MRGGDWFTSVGSRHLVPTKNPREAEYAALQEEAAKNAKNREERHTATLKATRNEQKEQRIRTFRELGLNEDTIKFILREADGFAIEYILNLNKAVGQYRNRNGSLRDIRKKYSDRINRLSDNDLRSFLKATNNARNNYILPI